MERIERVQYITLGTSATQIEHEVQEVLKGGCKWIQLRMKESSEESIIDVGKRIKPMCAKFGAKLIINDSAHICKILDADGVHLGKSDISTDTARQILGAQKIIGRTCNTAEDVINISNEKIDYIGLGPLRFTTTKKLLSPIIGIDGYAKIVSNTIIPIVAVGGITPNDIKPLLDNGVYGVALSGTIAKSENISKTTSDIINIIEHR